MTTFAALDTPGLLAHLESRRLRGQIEGHHGFLLELFKALKRLAPRGETRRFVGSWTPYGRTSPSAALRHAKSHAGPQADATVSAALRGWRPGDHAGIATAHPGALRLVYGHSKKAKAAWHLRALEAALRKRGFS